MKLNEILLSEDVVKSINDNIDYLLEIIPEIKKMIGFEHKNPHHHLDVFNHTLLALSLSKNDFDVRLCLLLHDIGKPYSYQETNDGFRHYYNHQIVSSNMSKDILKRLGYEEEYIKYICYLIKQHDSPITSKQINENFELCLKLYEVQRCDALAHNPEKLEKRKIYLEKTKKLINKSGDKNDKK